MKIFRIFFFWIFEFSRHLTLEQNNNMRMGIYMQQGVKEIIKSHKQDAMQSLSKLQSLTYLNVNIKLDVSESF